MAFDTTETIGAPGLLFPFVTHSIETGVIQDACDQEGGFVLWTKKGEPGKVYSVKPETDAIFAGIAQRTLRADSYNPGDVVNVVKTGRLWVRTASETLAGSPAYIDATGKLTATTGGTAIPGATFKGNAAEGRLVELEIV